MKHSRMTKLGRFRFKLTQNLLENFRVERQFWSAEAEGAKRPATSLWTARHPTRRPASTSKAVSPLRSATALQIADGAADLCRIEHFK